MNKDEKELREELAKHLGVEFCTEEELEEERLIAETEIKNTETGEIKTIRKEIPKIGVNEIIEQCNIAMQKMSKKNSHRYLLYLCASALKQMTDRLAMYEAKVN